MDDETKQQLLAQFQEYLETAGFSSEEGEAAPDLFTLLGEMAALRNEVKIESRQFKTALDEFKEVFGLLHSGHEQLSRKLDKYREDLKNQRREVTRAMLLELIDVYDRLAAGLAVLANYRPLSKFFGAKTPKQDRRFIQGVEAGQTMTLRRVEQILAKYQVSPIDALHKPMNPHWMVAVEIDNQPELADGIVTEELRKGFLWNEDVLRLAEVKVNKP